MSTIFKYPLEITDQQNVYLPQPAEIVHIGEQDGKLMLWAIVDNSAEMKCIIIMIFPTGVHIPKFGIKYLKTVEMSNGLVWHVFRGVD